jgi:hypothetical protein
VLFLRLGQEVCFFVHIWELCRVYIIVKISYLGVCSGTFQVLSVVETARPKKQRHTAVRWNFEDIVEFVE